MLEYGIMGILAWGAFGRGGVGFPWGLLTFCVCFGIGMSVSKIGWITLELQMFGRCAADAAGSFYRFVAFDGLLKR